MKRSAIFVGTGTLLVIAGIVAALWETRSKRIILYNQLRKFGLPGALAMLLAEYWPERLVTWTVAVLAVK